MVLSRTSSPGRSLALGTILELKSGEKPIFCPALRTPPIQKLTTPKVQPMSVPSPSPLVVGEPVHFNPPSFPPCLRWPRSRGDNEVGGWMRAAPGGGWYCSQALWMIDLRGTCTCTKHFLVLNATCRNGDVHAYTCLGMANMLDSTGDLGGAGVVFRDSYRFWVDTCACTFSA